MAVLNNIDSQNCVNYFESYIDCIDNMALEFQKLISSLREIFINYRSIHNELSKIMHIFIHAKIKKQHCKKMKFKLTRIMFEAQDYQSSRLEIIQCMFEMMENKSRQMEQVYKLTGVERPQMDISKSETVVKENSINSEREQRQSKRAKRASNKLDENDLALGNNEHSIKIDNNGSINSSVMSKMSSAQVAAKKAAAAKKKKRKTTNRQNQTQKDDDSTKPIIDSSIDPDEPTYCLCDQISYGEMICCDNDSCPIEWFHFDCVSLSTKPKGKWFCPNCRGDRPNVMKPKAVLLKELEKYRKK